VVAADGPQEVPCGRTRMPHAAGHKGLPVARQTLSIQGSDTQGTRVRFSVALRVRTISRMPSTWRMCSVRASWSTWWCWSVERGQMP